MTSTRTALGLMLAAFFVSGESHAAPANGPKVGDRLAVYTPKVNLNAGGARKLETC